MSTLNYQTNIFQVFMLEQQGDSTVFQPNLACYQSSESPGSVFSWPCFHVLWTWTPVYNQASSAVSFCIQYKRGIDLPGNVLNWGLLPFNSYWLYTVAYTGYAYIISKYHAIPHVLNASSSFIIEIVTELLAKPLSTCTSFKISGSST